MKLGSTLSLILGLALAYSLGSVANAGGADVSQNESSKPSKSQPPFQPPNEAASVVNWGTPSKRELVERAASDGMNDPSEIVKFAKNHRVIMTVKEVRRILAEFKKK